MMMCRRIGFACFVFAVATAIFFPDSTAEASDNLHQYKFPCIPGDACYITQLNHGGAFDFDPQGSAGLGSIPAVSEGIFDGYFGSGGCTYPNPGDPGRFARVLDIHGRTMIYAHLSSLAISSLDNGCSRETSLESKETLAIPTIARHTFTWEESRRRRA